MAKQKTPPAVTVDFGWIWEDLRKYGFSGMVTCALFFVLYQAGSWAGTKSEEAVVWTGQNVIKPTVAAQSVTQESIAEAIKMNGEAIRMSNQTMLLCNKTLENVSGALVEISEVFKGVREDNRQTRALMAEVLAELRKSKEQKDAP